MVADASATRLGTDTGQFSLAGAPSKLALYFDSKKKRWGVPEGRTPTTHILKPATGAYDGQVENEHFCLRLAAELGFPTARSRVMTCDETPVIVIERYDRLEKNGIVRRIHQEDFCQAAGIRPQLKYQNQEGSVTQGHRRNPACFPLLRGGRVRFVDTLIFHWLTAGPDAHAKNYSINSIAPGTQARLLRFMIWRGAPCRRVYNTANPATQGHDGDEDWARTIGSSRSAVGIGKSWPGNFD